MGCKKRHFSFHIAQTAPIVIRYAFVLQKIMDCSTGKRERRIVLMHFLLKSSQALAGKYDVFFPLRPRTSTMLNRGSYHVIAQIFLTLAKMTLALARMGVGEDGDRSSVCCQIKGVVFNHVLEIRCLTYLQF